MSAERSSVIQEAQFQEARTAYLGNLASADAIKVGSIVLNDGSESMAHVDHMSAMTMPEASKSGVDVMAAYLGGTFNSDAVLVNIESGPSPQLTAAVAYALGWRQIVVSARPRYLEPRTVFRLTLPSDLEERPASALVLVNGTTNIGDIQTPLALAKEVQYIVGERDPNSSVPSAHLMDLVSRNPASVSSKLEEWDLKLHYAVSLAEVVGAARHTFSAHQLSQLESEFPELAV